MNPSVIYSIPSKKINYPEFLYIDTNVLAEIGLNRRYKTKLVDFMKQAAVNDTMFVCSTHMYDELKQTIHVEVLKKEMVNLQFVPDSKIKKPDWKQFEDTDVNIGSTTISKFNSIVTRIKSITSNTIIDLEDLPTREIQTVTDSYIGIGIAPKDAKHSALMNLHGVNNILTIDKGFTKVPDINIYSPNMTKKGDKPNNFVSVK